MTFEASRPLESDEEQVIETSSLILLDDLALRYLMMPENDNPSENGMLANTLYRFVLKLSVFIIVFVCHPIGQSDPGTTSYIVKVK